LPRSRKPSLAGAASVSDADEDAIGDVDSVDWRMSDGRIDQ